MAKKKKQKEILDVVIINDCEHLFLGIENIEDSVFEKYDDVKTSARIYVLVD
jgi:hypothetical protein